MVAAIAVCQLFAEFVDFGVVLAGEDFAKRREARGHGDRVRVVSAAVEDLVLR